MTKLTWKEIKAHPLKALRHIKRLEQEPLKSYARYRQVITLLGEKAELIDYARRLESEVYDLKKRFDLPRDQDFRPVCMNQE